MSIYEREFEEREKITDFPRKIQNYLRKEIGASKLAGKWKTCNKGKSNVLYGSIISLLGCISFWVITRHKIVRQINDELKIFTPKELKNIAWALNIGLKGIGGGLMIKGLFDFKKCK